MHMENDQNEKFYWSKDLYSSASYVLQSRPKHHVLWAAVNAAILTRHTLHTKLIPIKDSDCVFRLNNGYM